MYVIKTKDYKIHTLHDYIHLSGDFIRLTAITYQSFGLDKQKRLAKGKSLLFGGSGWIRTTEGGANRFTVCPLWPLGNTPIFDFIKKWSWWTDLNPRPADYKSAALPTELHQRLMLEQYNTIFLGCQAHFSIFFKKFIFQ